MKLLKALLELNMTLLMEMYETDYELVLGDRDFDRFVRDFEKEMKHLISYPELKADLSKTTYVKIAGPGAYFHVRRRPIP